jgi:aminocarboxymuconate-semialdehyde decarboxylase
MYYDTCVFDADSLEYLAKKATAARLMLGSDAPFPIGDPEPKKVVDTANFSAADKEKILSLTAQSVFRLRADCAPPRF